MKAVMATETEVVAAIQEAVTVVVIPVQDLVEEADKEIKADQHGPDKMKVAAAAVRIQAIQDAMEIAVIPVAVPAEVTTMIILPA
jgi:hypothetical protein